MARRSPSLWTLGPPIGHNRRKTWRRLIHHVQYLAHWISLLLTSENCCMPIVPMSPTEAPPRSRKQLTDKEEQGLYYLLSVLCSEGLTSDVRKCSLFEKLEEIERRKKQGAV